jgi:hypothetical protein
MDGNDWRRHLPGPQNPQSHTYARRGFLIGLLLLAVIALGVTTFILFNYAANEPATLPFLGGGRKVSLPEHFMICWLLVLLVVLFSPYAWLGLALILGLPTLIGAVMDWTGQREVAAVSRAGRDAR